MKVGIFFIAALLISLSEIVTAAPDATSSDTLKKEKTGIVFGILYGGFFHNLTENYTPPRTAFEIKSAILGYKNQFGKNVDATIMFDVSKTTRDIKEKYDTTQISFLEGNNYTVYLKIAEVRWKINKYAELSLGQMLCSQYMLIQDKFWDHRYIQYTFQEIDKYGPPADLGARLKITPFKKLAVSFCAVNGEGPARWQDLQSKFAYSCDAEYKNSDSLVFRIYGDYREPTGSLAGQQGQSVLNGFAGYIYKNLKFGVDYSYIYHVNFEEKSISGFSFFTTCRFLGKLEAIARIDVYQNIADYKTNRYFITGFQYEPYKNYFLSLNFRELWPNPSSQLYLNFGAKF